MSRADLDNIQAQLRVAIQNHQVLVMKMKNDPQDVGLQRQLHDLQSQITTLSEKQRSVVQLLKKELVTKQTPISANTTSLESSSIPHQGAPAACAPLGQRSVPMNAHQNTPITKPHAVLPLQLVRPPTISGPRMPFANPVPIAQKPVKSSYQLNNNNIGKVQRSQIAPSNTPSSPIRVPQFSTHRPSILQGGLGHRPVLTKPTNGVPAQQSSVRRSSDTDIVNISRSSMDRKQLSPDERKKQEYMASLDLITPDTLKELQSKKSERKRRSTANPQFSYGQFEPQQKRCYLTNVTLPQVPRKRGRPPKHQSVPQEAAIQRGSLASPASSSSISISSIAHENSNDSNHDDVCAACGRSGELLICDMCEAVYHLQCVEPPLTAIPQGLWSCSKCQANGNQGSENWPGTLALVHSYITHKAVKEEDKKRLQKKNEELESERSELETKAKQLTDAINKQIQQKTDLLGTSHTAQQSVDKLKNFIRVFQTS